MITLMFSVVANKPRTLSSLPYSGNEQVCRSWEGAQPGRWAKLASGNTPYHGQHAQIVNGDWLGYGNVSSLFCEFKSSLVLEFGLFREFHKIHKICELWVLQSLLGGCLQLDRQVVRKLYSI